MRRRLQMYRALVLIMLIGFLAFVVAENKQYMDLLEVCDEYDRNFQEASERQSEVVEAYQNSYDELQTKYAEKIIQLDQTAGVMQSPVVYSKQDLELLAKCCLAEAGDFDNHATSQQYVASVILNRVASENFPDNIYDVIYQKDNGVPQFSVAYNGMIDEVELYTDTVLNVYSVLMRGSQLPSNVLFFYSESVTENWVNTLETYTTCQGTVFAKGEDE